MQIKMVALAGGREVEEQGVAGWNFSQPRSAVPGMALARPLGSVTGFPSWDTHCFV